MIWPPSGSVPFVLYKSLLFCCMEMKKFGIVIAIALATCPVLADSSWESGWGRTVVGASDHCAILRSGNDLLRCDGVSFIGNDISKPQKATLVFACFTSGVFASLSHGKVSDKVLTYEFQDDTGQFHASDDHRVQSQVRTSFPSSNRTPLWIYRAVSFDRQIEQLSFSLNDGEVRGQFPFNDSDRILYQQFFLDQCAIDLTQLQDPKLSE